MSIEGPEPQAVRSFEQTHPELYAVLAEDCARFWSELSDEDRARSDRDAFIASEIGFIERAYGAITSLAATHEGRITLLLDVDETFVRNKRLTYGGEVTAMYVRPGLNTLLTMLDADATVGDRYDIGLLTGRSYSQLAEEYANPQYGYMQRLGERLNPDFIISSEPNSPIYEQESLQGIPQAVITGEEDWCVDAIRSIMRPEMIEPALAGDREALERLVYRGVWYNSKLPILAYLVETYPDRGFVYVDNDPYADTIDPTHSRVRGVALGEAAFTVPPDPPFLL